MSEKVLGILRAKRLVFSILPSVHEFLLFTPDRVIVARQSTKLPFYASGATLTDVSDILDLLKMVKVEDILKSGKHNFVIPKSEITKVELKKRQWSDPQWSWIELNIITSKKPQASSNRSTQSKKNRNSNPT